MNIIKELRTKTKLSQSAFACKFKVPIKTLQKWEQGISKPLPYLISLIQNEINIEEFIDISKYMIKPKNTFRPVITCSFKNIDKIHPSQQQRVADIIDTLKKYKQVKKIIIFGSSLTYKCHYNSDIDIYVELSEEINVKKYNIDCRVDFWTNYTIEPIMYEEVINKGVCVYVC